MEGVRFHFLEPGGGGHQGIKGRSNMIHLYCNITTHIYIHECLRNMTAEIFLKHSKKRLFISCAR